MPESYSPETRQDRLTKEWVACAPARSSRPHKTAPPTRDTNPTDDPPVEGCPFCPGHEEELPSVLWQLDAPDARPWQTRVVPNKYPALTPSPPPNRKTEGLYRTRASYGRQEVIIDTPHHHQGFAQMPVSQVEAVLHTYQSRYHTLRQSDPPLYPFVFRNHGARAGASIAHPHSQIIATDFPPPRIEREEQEARARYEENGHCPYCAMIEDELGAEDRIVFTNDAFVVFVPFAARAPYELWFLPRTHEPEFGRLSEKQRSALASVLHEGIRRLHDRLDDPDYNFFIRTALAYESDAPHLHWSLRLQPRLSVDAGFELGTGVHVNPSIPERDAAVLREKA